MLTHFVLSVGQHPFGHDLREIVSNVRAGMVAARPRDLIAADLVSRMLVHDPAARPATRDVLSHVHFWSAERRWDLLMRCCGRGAPPDCPIVQVHADLDQLGRTREMNTKWASVPRRTCEGSFGADDFPQTPSGLPKFLGGNLDSWRELRLAFLELFPILTLNFMRLLEQTQRIAHPHFQPSKSLPD